MGIALAGHGGGITAEAADVVILNDDLARVVEAIRISRRTVRIARQSIWTGLGLSAAAMLVASAGYIPPPVGALLQEAIDVAVILNALRTSRQPRETLPSPEALAGEPIEQVGATSPVGVRQEFPTSFASRHAYIVVHSAGDSVPERGAPCR